MGKIVGGVLIVLVALTACSSSGDVDDQTLLAELKAVGVTPAKSIADWRETMRGAVCDGTERALELSFTFKGTTQSMIDSAEVAARHWCPDRLPIIERAVPQP